MLLVLCQCSKFIKVLTLMHFNYLYTVCIEVRMYASY